MRELTEDDTIDVLSAIKTFHSPQDDGDVTIKMWTVALRYGRVTNGADAVEAVVRHYTTPGANPFITPGDVIEKYREIRNARLQNIDHGDVTQDVDASDVEAYLATLRMRIAAIADGATLAQANALPLPPAAAHAAIGPAAHRQIGRGQ
jgi:hypothetical protein